MGNSISDILINLDRKNSFYFTDEIISGTVNWNTAADKIEVYEIYIMLVGEIGYTTRQTILNTKSRSKKATKYHRIPFYSIKFPFVTSKLGERELILHQEQYSWPFYIPLTNYLPPTLCNPKSYPHVRYYLQVIVDKPWYKLNRTLTRYITIYPHVSLLGNPQCLLSTTFGNRNRKEIQLKVILNKSGYVPGDSIDITLEITNPQKVLIRSIHTFLFQSYIIGKSTGRDTIFQTILPNIISSQEQQIRQIFSIMIPPIPQPPSYRFLGGIEKLVFIYNEHFLRFTVKVEGILTDFDVDIPIILGTQTTFDLN